MRGRTIFNPIWRASLWIDAFGSILLPLLLLLLLLRFFRCIVDYAFGVDLGAPFFPGGHELWHHQLAYSAAAAAELPSAALQHATLVHPALHPQVPVRSYL